MRHIPSKAVNHGLNWDKTSWRDNMYVRCERCGFINNLDREPRSHPGGYEGWGLNFEVEATYSTYDGMGSYDSGAMGNIPNIMYDDSGNIMYDDSGNIMYDGPLIIATAGTVTYDNLLYEVTDPVVTSGCSQCGTLLYNNKAHWTKG